MVEKWWFSDPSSPSTMTYQLLALYCKQGLFLIFLSSIFIFLLSSFYYLPYLFIIDTQKFDNSLLYYQRRGIWKCNYFWFFFFHDQLFQIFTIHFNHPSLLPLQGYLASQFLKDIGDINCEWLHFPSLTLHIKMYLHLQLFLFTFVNSQ